MQTSFIACKTFYTVWIKWVFASVWELAHFLVKYVKCILYRMIIRHVAQWYWHAHLRFNFKVLYTLIRPTDRASLFVRNKIACQSQIYDIKFRSFCCRPSARKNNPSIHVKRKLLKQTFLRTNKHFEYL